MRTSILTILCALIFITYSENLPAQKQAKKTERNVSKKYPATFNISTAEFNGLFNLKEGEKVNNKSNRYINKSTVMMNTQNGDTRFMRIKLDYFKNAFLMIQVNGEYSTQVFILSEDKSVFYKGTIGEKAVVMNKCSEDDIVSE